MVSIAMRHEISVKLRRSLDEACPEKTVLGICPNRDILPGSETTVSLRGLLPAGFGVTAARAIGYSQAIAQLEGSLSQEQAIEQTAVLTRKYARRQVSWFRRYSRISWFEYDDPALRDSARQLTLPYA